MRRTEVLFATTRREKSVSMNCNRIAQLKTTDVIYIDTPALNSFAIPIIFHDYFLAVLENKTAPKGFSSSRMAFISARLFDHLAKP